MVVKAVVFDLWNTLAQRRSNNPARVLQILGITPTTANIRLYEHAVMTKNFTTVHGLVLTLCEAFNLTPDEKHFKAIEKIVEDPQVEFFADVIQTLSVLRGSYKVCVLSNTYRSAMKKLNTKIFDYIFLSCDIGAVKPDIHAFRFVEETLQLKPNELVMVGDSLENDVRGAERAGWHAVHVDRSERKIYTPRVGTLSELPVLLARWHS